MGEPADAQVIHALDIKVSDDGQTVLLMLRTNAFRATMPMAPERLAGFIDVLQKAAALAAERRRAATARMARQ